MPLAPPLEGVEAGVALPKAHTYRTLDAWPGVACFWVLWFHSTAPLVDLLHIRTGPLYVLPLYGGLGIWMFFVISGYCIAHAGAQNLEQKRGLWPYAVARFRRIYPPCWFFLMFCLAASALASALVAQGHLRSSALSGKGILHQSLSFHLCNLSLTQVLSHQNYISDVCWALCYEVAFYALVGISVALAARFGEQRRLLTGLHGLTMVSLLVFIGLPHWIAYPFDYWPMFGLGIFVYDLTKHKRRASGIAFLAAGILICVFAWRNIGGVGYHGDGGRLLFLFGLAFAVVILLAHRHDGRLSRLPLVQGLSWVGLFSYSLYLIYVLIIGLAMQVLGRLRLETLWLTVPACITTSVTVGYIFHQFFERPFLRKRPNP